DDTLAHLVVAAQVVRHGRAVGDRGRGGEGDLVEPQVRGREVAVAGAERQPVEQRGARRGQQRGQVAGGPRVDVGQLGLDGGGRVGLGGARPARDDVRQQGLGARGGGAAAGGERELRPVQGG